MKEIAAELRISYHTVRTHTQSAYRTIGVHNKMEATALLMSKGIIPRWTS